jgi:hypothetical protein
MEGSRVEETRILRETIMTKRIYKLVPRFPGILVPTYSKEEYQKVVKSEGRTLTFLFAGLCAGSAFIAVLGFLTVFSA